MDSKEEEELHFMYIKAYASHILANEEQLENMWLTRILIIIFCGLLAFIYFLTCQDCSNACGEQLSSIISTNHITIYYIIITLYHHHMISYYIVISYIIILYNYLLN